MKCVRGVFGTTEVGGSDLWWKILIYVYMHLLKVSSISKSKLIVWICRCTNVERLCCTLYKTWLNFHNKLCHLHVCSTFLSSHDICKYLLALSSSRSLWREDAPAIVLLPVSGERGRGEEKGGDAKVVINTKNIH